MNLAWAPVATTSRSPANTVTGAVTGAWAGWLLIAFLSVLTACSPLRLLDATVDDDAFTARSGLTYGSEARQRLDVYVPKQGAGPFPVVVFFYGGSWRGGNRGDYRFVAEALASRGHITVVPDYRVYPNVQFPAFVEDGAKAVRWVLDNIAEFGGDSDRLYLMGHSAGAHIAAMLALDETYLAAEGVEANRIRGTIGLAGPYAFYPSRTENVAPVFAGLANEDAARPITFVDGTESPLLLLHGSDDGTVFLFNTTALAKAARDAGIPARHIVYPDVGHLGILLALSRPFRDKAPVVDDVSAFIAGQNSVSAGN